MNSRIEIDAYPWRYPDACDFLAREVFDVPLRRPIGFIVKPRIRVKAPSRPHEQQE